jgi:hypothetical protein
MRNATLEAMIEEATVDAYNDDEQLTGLYTMIEEQLADPFTTTVLGVEVTVRTVDLTDDGIWSVKPVIAIRMRPGYGCWACSGVVEYLEQPPPDVFELVVDLGDRLSHLVSGLPRSVCRGAGGGLAVT